MFGRRVDLSDGQYRFFREELPTLTAAAIGFLALSHAVRHFSNNVRPSAFHRVASAAVPLATWACPAAVPLFRLAHRISAELCPHVALATAVPPRAALFLRVLFLRVPAVRERVVHGVHGRDRGHQLRDQRAGRARLGPHGHGCDVGVQQRHPAAQRALPRLPLVVAAGRGRPGRRELVVAAGPGGRVAGRSPRAVPVVPPVQPGGAAHDLLQFRPHLGRPAPPRPRARRFHTLL